MARPRVHDDALRIRLLEAASAAIAEGGPNALSLRAVAAQAGTTTAAVYSLFGNREALVAAVAEEGFRRFGDYLAAVPHTDDAWADLLALGVAYRDNALANPHFYRVMFTFDADTVAQAQSDGEIAGRAVGEPTFEVHVAAVARATGLATESSRTIAIRLWALSHGLVSLELAGMLPGTAAQRREAYVAALRSARFDETRNPLSRVPRRRA